jgi:hypothetical protein
MSKEKSERMDALKQGLQGRVQKGMKRRNRRERRALTWVVQQARH